MYLAKHFLKQFHIFNVSYPIQGVLSLSKRHQIIFKASCDTEIDWQYKYCVTTKIWILS